MLIRNIRLVQNGPFDGPRGTETAKSGDLWKIWKFLMYHFFYLEALSFDKTTELRSFVHV